MDKAPHRLTYLGWLAQCGAMAARARLGRSTRAPEAGVVVSLTTYGSRAGTVHLTIESILRGTVVPREIILWVDEDRLLQDPPAGLRRLAARGDVRIAASEGLGPHTKYFPYVRSVPGDFEVPLVTADDDLLYPRHWLEQLMRAYAGAPDDVHCHRAHRIGVTGTGLAPYSSWSPCRDTERSNLSFATGVSGVLYPPRVLEQLRSEGTGFLDRCPRADDVWLNWVTLRAGSAVRQVAAAPSEYPTIPLTQRRTLMVGNVAGGQNDEALRRTYGSADVAELLAQAR
jgi:hypothetical protein